MIRSASSTYSAIRRVSKSAITMASQSQTCVNTPILGTLRPSRNPRLIPGQRSRMRGTVEGNRGESLGPGSTVAQVGTSRALPWVRYRHLDTVAVAGVSLRQGLSTPGGEELIRPQGKGIARSTA